MVRAGVVVGAVVAREDPRPVHLRTTVRMAMGEKSRTRSTPRPRLPGAATRRRTTVSTFSPKVIFVPSSTYFSSTPNPHLMSHASFTLSPALSLLWL